MVDIDVGVWYKHRGDFAFIYIQNIESIYDDSVFIIKYMWIGELVSKDDATKSMFCETSEFTSGSAFHKVLYKITRPDLIPPPNVVAKCKLIISELYDGYMDLYPGFRKPGQIHPWKTWEK